MRRDAPFLDRAIATLSPSWALRRTRARAALNILERHFEGASLARRTSKWKAPSTGPNDSSLPALETLRNRCRDLVRNNPWAQSAVDIVRTNVVGSGIIPTPLGPTRGSKNAKDIWKDWAETQACDADGTHDLYGLEGLIQETVSTSGECLVRRRRRRTTDSLPIPLQLQVLEPDFLDHSKDRLLGTNGDRILGGIQFDALNRRQGYWMFEDHPGETFRFGSGTFTSHLVPASELLHVYEKRRPGQVRGVPDLASAVIRLRELDELEDAALVREKIAACFAAFERDMEMPDDPLTTPLPVPETPEDEYSIQPGTVRRLGAGKTVEFGRPPVTNDLQPMQRSMLRSIARAAGITYEQLTGDYSQVNYSSARMGFLEASRRVEERRWRMMVPQALGGWRGGIWSWFAGAGELVGHGTLEVRARWTAPRREMIDPAKEVPALKEAVRSGFQSYSETLREYGYNPEEVVAEIANDAALLDRFGVILDSDARRPVAGASAQ